MESSFFRLNLPDDIKKMVAELAAGMRLRFPGPESKHNPIYRQKRNQRICQRANEGATLKSLKAEFNLSERRLQEILQENGIKLRVTDKKSMLRELDLMKKLNLPKTEMAKRLNISRQYLYTLLKEES